MSTPQTFSQYLPVIKNELGDTIHYTWPLPDSVEYSKNEVIIKFRKNALLLHKLCYNYQGPPTQPDPDQDYANAFKSEMMSEEFPVDSLIADPALKMTLHQFGGLYLTRITAANPCTDTLSITRYGDTVACDNYLWMTLKLNNDTSVINACLALTIYYQYVLDIAEPNYYGHFNATPVDQLFGDHDQTYKQRSLWLNYTNVERAWDFQRGSNKIKVGIIDDGIDYRHCDLGYFYGGNKVKDGWNYVSDPQEAIFYKDSPHGTSIAGIIGAFTDGTNIGCTHTGIAGIAGGWYSAGNFGCALYGFKIDIKKGTKNEILINRAIAATLDAASDYVFKNGLSVSYAVHVLNCSWGFGVYSPSLNDAFNFAFEQGVSIVCSRGNIVSNQEEETQEIWYPAQFSPSWIFSVGGYNHEHTRINDSWYGYNMDILGPAYADDISTTYTVINGNGTYIHIGQTSMAAAHVSGAIALLRSEFEENSKYSSIKAEPEDYQNMIKAAAHDIKEEDGEDYLTGYDNFSGWGELKIGKIFEMLDEGHNLYHDKITQLNTPEEFSGPLESIRLVSRAKEKYTEKFYNAQKREITGSKTLTGFNLPQLYVWGRSGKSDNTGKGGLNEATPLYKSTKYTEVTSGQGGNGLVKGIYHNNSLTVTARTFQYKLFDPITNQLVGYVPESLSDIELYFSIFGKKNGTSVNDYVVMDNSNYIYPNPASEQFVLRFKTENICSPFIRIYNYLGQIVYVENCGQLLPDFHDKIIEVKNLNQGSYTVEINLGDSSQTQKLMIIK